MEYKKLELDTDILIGTFELNRNVNYDLLHQLIDISGEIEEKYIPFLKEHYQALLIEGDFWNEEELKMNFLSYLFFCANISEPKKIKVFYERSLTEVINNYKLNVVCDCLVAKPFGIYTPDKPFFFLQEFKKQKKSGDAEAQMLAAMLIAQKKNGNSKPVFGCFLQGKYWQFASLIEKEYCVSETFDTRDYNTLIKVILILRNLKTIILRDLL